MWDPTPRPRPRPVPAQCSSEAKAAERSHAPTSPCVREAGREGRRAASDLGLPVNLPEDVVTARNDGQGHSPRWEHRTRVCACACTSVAGPARQPWGRPHTSGEVGQQSSPAVSPRRAGGRVQGEAGVDSSEPLGERPALSPERAIPLPVASKQMAFVPWLGILPAIPRRRRRRPG